MKDPYKILGMTPDDSPDDLRERYEELKMEYSEERFAEGDRGARAARNLSDLEAAWRLIQQDIRRAETASEFGGEYGAVEHAIELNNLDNAQSALDEIGSHDAKWHYYQSIIFYKRDWLSESRAQLIIAVQMDPDNAKYRESLRKMNAIIGSTVPPNGQNANGQAQDVPPPPPYTDPTPEQRATDGMNACAQCLTCYCCSEACCSSMRWC